MDMEPTYHLEGIIKSKDEFSDFEGPLTLILMLLSKNKIEIRDIPVSEILEQYLAYLDQMKSMDLEIASEFVQMAAHLLFIKTKMLLSSEEEVNELELLIASLEQLKAKDVYSGIKEVCPDILRASEYGSLYHVKAPEQLPNMKEYRYEHATWELLKSISNAFLRNKSISEEPEELPERKRRLYPKRIVYNVRDKSREILLRLSAKGNISIKDFYRMSHSRSEVVATFISILELCSMGHANINRDGEDVIVSFSGGDIDSIMESIGE